LIITIVLVVFGQALLSRTIAENNIATKGSATIEDILARGEVTVTFVEMIGDEGKLAQLRTGQHAVRNRNAQHGCQTLYVKTILKSQRQKFCGCRKAMLRTS
jgi:hypothetical protein